MPTDVISYMCKCRPGLKEKKKENAFQTREFKALWWPEVPSLGLLSHLMIPLYFATRKENCAKQGKSYFNDLSSTGFVVIAPVMVGRQCCQCCTGTCQCCSQCGQLQSAVAMQSYKGTVASENGRQKN